MVLLLHRPLPAPPRLLRQDESSASFWAQVWSISPPQGPRLYLTGRLQLQTGPGAAREENKNLTVTAQQRLPPAPESQLFLKPAGPWV